MVLGVMGAWTALGLLMAAAYAGLPIVRMMISVGYGVGLPVYRLMGADPHYNGLGTLTVGYAVIGGMIGLLAWIVATKRT